MGVVQNTRRRTDGEGAGGSSGSCWCVAWVPMSWMLLRQPAQNRPNRRLKAPKEKNWPDNFEICSDNIFQQQVKGNLTSSCRCHTIFQKVTPCFLRPCKHAQARNPSHKWGAGRTVLGQGAAARRMRPLDRGTAERGISRSELEQRKLLGRARASPLSTTMARRRRQWAVGRLSTPG